MTNLIYKYDDKQELVYGWLIVCKERDAMGNLVDCIDKQGDIITEDAARNAMQKMMAGENRHVLDSHSGKPIGKIVFAFPETSDILKAEGRDMRSVEKTGIKVAVQVGPEYIEKYKNGEYASFSIGGHSPVYAN